MLKTRIILMVIAALLVLLIFNLPKVVVDNDADKSIESGSGQPVAEVKSSPNAPSTQAHAKKIDINTEKTAKNLKEKLAVSENIEKSTIFADSLGELYLGLERYDSAAKFIEIVATNAPSIENWRRAGDAYYSGFSFAMDAQKKERMGQKAREYYEKVLAESGDDLEVKNNLAMTYVSTTNPMKGIMMLREIITQDPDNETALMSLGALSMQSGQYDKAVERYKALVESNPNHVQARFYLGLCYVQTGQKEKAREQFLKLKDLDDDPQLQAEVDRYLEEIK